MSSGIASTVLMWLILSPWLIQKDIAEDIMKEPLPDWYGDIAEDVMNEPLQAWCGGLFRY